MYLLLLLLLLFSCKSVDVKVIDKYQESKIAVTSSIKTFVEKSIKEPEFKNCLPMANEVQNKIYENLEASDRLIVRLQESKLNNEKSKKTIVILIGILSSIVLGIASFVAFKIFI